MALYLVQHGNSFSKNEDPQQGLTPDGENSVRRIAAAVGKQKINVRSITHSGKKRAEQTAVIFSEYLSPPDGIMSLPGLKPLDDVVTFASGIAAVENRMIVGHLPFMERLVSFLLLGTPEPRVVTFQNSGIVCLAQDAKEAGWTIRWALMPEMR